MNNDKSSPITFQLSNDVIESIKRIAEILKVTEEDATIYLLSVGLAFLKSQELSEAKTPLPDL